MGNQILPGIKKVEYGFASDIMIPEMDLFQEGDTVTLLPMQFHDMCLSGLGKGELNEKTEEGERIYETKITFFTGERPVSSSRFLCYRITTVQGLSYLIGTGKRPFPMRQWKQTLPDQVTQKQGYEVTITYKNLHPLLLIGN